MRLTGFVKENKIVLPEGIRFPEGAIVELEVFDTKAIELPGNVKDKFWELIGAGESGKQDISSNKHKYLLEVFDERPEK